MRVLRSLMAVALARRPRGRAGLGRQEAPRPPAADSAGAFDGLFGSFDRAAAQRGFQVYKEVCSNCHSMHQLSYRNLASSACPMTRSSGIAATVQVHGRPERRGRDVRAGRASLRPLPIAPSPTRRRPRAANNGALPPDLSLIIKAREGGADYIHALLTGYEDPPAGVTLQDGHELQQVLPRPPDRHAAAAGSEGQVDYADGTQATVEQMARDVITFLAWAAEPELEQRKAIGWRWVLFFLILAGLAYAVKRKVWADVH